MDQKDHILLKLKLALKEIFDSDEKTHGYQHALEVEELTKQISNEYEFLNINIDSICLSAAALFHDTGYTRYDPSWKPGQTEHVLESVEIAREFLSTIPPFNDNPDMLRIVCYLIKHHDRTNHAFPILNGEKRCAEPILTEIHEVDWPFLYPSEYKMVGSMLAILKEADGRTATGITGANRTLKYSLERGITLFSQGNPLDSWAWEVSAIGNVRLAAKRALLDSYSDTGRQLAWQGYLEAEDLIKEHSIQNKVEYYSELHQSILSNEKYETDYDEFRINRIYPWSEFEKILRSIKLRGDPNLRPYESVSIENQLVPIDCLNPTAYYVSTEDIRKVVRLNRRLLSHYAQSPFDMSSLIELNTSYVDPETNQVNWLKTSPPIVEVYTETKGKYKGKQVMALVDGLHRCYVAKQLGYDKIRAVVISNLPHHLPLVPLPLSWNDVKIFDGVPTKKRDYRFERLEDLPEISSFSSININHNNFKYFFYRDLSPLGSEGIRKPING